MSWHWLSVTGHVALVAWPYVATALTAFFWSYGNFLNRELNTKTEELALVRNGTASCGRCARILLENEQAWDAAREWEERYRAQRAVCRAEHMDRPLPTMPLNAAQAQELEENLPF